MKQDLLALIEQTDEIESRFHISGGSTAGFSIINDVPEFVIWKRCVQLELQEIYDRTRDKFIWDALIAYQHVLNGYNDVVTFNNLKGYLLAIKPRLGKYYGEEEREVHVQGTIIQKDKQPKVFVSHSSRDRKYAGMIVNLLKSMGIRDECIFCSSIPGYDIGIGQDIYEHLKNLFRDYNLHVLFLLSQNYYKSPASLNEMGAAWVLRSSQTTILLPGFEFSEIKGAVNPREIALKLDNEEIDVKHKLNQLKDTMVKMFNLPTIDGVFWEKPRDEFIKSVVETKHTPRISDEALRILQTASAKNHKIIVFIEAKRGSILSYGEGENKATPEEKRAIQELLATGLVDYYNDNREMLQVQESAREVIRKNPLSEV